MKHIKRILSITICLLIMLTSAFYSYTRIDSRCLVYADSTTDNWQNVTTNEQLVEAFKYYCKSRDLTIEGSIADGVTSFTTKTFNGLCNTLGIDMTTLQAHLKYEIDENLGIRFLFDTTGISAYNRIFAQFLQDNELEVGDDNVDLTVYSGMTFKDYYDDTTLCTISNNYSISSFNISLNQLYVGSFVHGYNYTYFKNMHTTYFQGSVVTRNFGDYIGYKNYNNTQTITIPLEARIYQNGLSVNIDMVRAGEATDHKEGFIGIVYSPSYNQYHLCSISKDLDTNKYAISAISNTPIYPKNNEGNNITIKIVSNVINNNNYEGDTIINNYGTPSDPNAPDPDNPTYTPPDYPSEPTDDPSDWGVELPDLDIPWFLRGKEDKFPWDIPYSMILLLSVLNAEPEAPHIEGTLDLGVYEWNYELDLEQFDDVASICRNMMFVAFLFGLMLLTKRLIWG